MCDYGVTGSNAYTDAPRRRVPTHEDFHPTYTTAERRAYAVKQVEKWKAKIKRYDEGSR